MKKFYSFLVLFGIIFIGSVLRVNNVSAYYKDNCYAAQWEHIVNVKGDFDQHNIYSTKKLCYSNNKIEVGKLPDKTYSVSLPKYKDVEKDSVTVKYCTKMVAGVCITTNKQTFKLSDYNNDFGKMVKAMDDVLSGAAAPDGYTKIAFDKNDAQYSMEVQQSSDDDGAIGEIKKDCSNQGGARSLGWIICPIMSLLGEATEDIYNGAVEPALKVEPKLFSEANSNVEDAWSTFRNVANIVFVIIMLLVIFSQLTGVGIDNYGIKKILPKLVVVAVLTNLSYVLCVLAIDISNILGNSFQELFEGLKEGLNLNLDFGDGTVIGDQIKSTAGSMVGVGILAALVGMSGAIWEAPMIALSLLIGAIGVVVSVFFLFILLAAREAAIVVLVVLSPAAMVLYALPNTKKIFDKWLKAFEGLLLVYPIAGLLVGGGNYVSALLIHSGMGSDFFGALTAMIAGVLPIFFIPTMLKGSFSALGTIGARISGFGAGASKRVTGAVRNTEGFKGLQDRAGRFATRRKYETGRNAGAVSRFLRGGQYGMNRTRNQYFKDELDAIDQNMFGDDETFQQRLTSARSAAMSKGYAERVGGLDRAALIAEANSAGNWIGEAGGSERMSELIKTMESRGMENEIFGLLRRVDVGTNSGVMQTLANSNNKILKAYGKTGNGVSYNDFMAGTMYRDANGNITNQATSVDGNGNIVNNTSVSMQRYAEQKGGEFVDGLDDKALAEINRADGANGTSIMSTGQLTRAAANLNDEASIEQVNSMLAGRNDIDGVISGEQLTKFNNSTLLDLETRSHNDPAVKNAIIRASNAVMADPKLVASMNHENKTLINNIRSSRNLPPIP